MKSPSFSKLVGSQSQKTIYENYFDRPACNVQARYEIFILDAGFPIDEQSCMMLDRVL